MTTGTHFLDEVLAFLGPRLVAGEPMGPHCTYKVGGRAARFIEVRDDDELVRIARSLSSVELGSYGAAGEVHVVGRGSNLLVADSGLPGLVVQLGEGFGGIEAPWPGRPGDGVSEPDGGSSLLARVGGAASLPVVARRTVAAGLGGFEWAVGVPGSIGGAVRMNAGGHGSDMSTVLQGVRVVDLVSGEDKWMRATELELGYRTSSLEPTQVVVQVDLALAPGERQDGERRISEIVRWRRENQPGGPNAGSVFTNPPGDSAGRLIEAAGSRGLRVGTAAVSDKHANFIQADPGGSADDVVRLMSEVIIRVAEHSGIVLHPETVLLGFSSDALATIRGGVT